MLLIFKNFSSSATPKEKYEQLKVYCETNEIFIPIAERMSIPEYFLNLTHSSNFIQEDDQTDNDLSQDCESVQISDYQKNSKKELLVLASQHNLNPKNYWLKEDLLNKLRYHISTAHRVSFHPDLSKWM